MLVEGLPAAAPGFVQSIAHAAEGKNLQELNSAMDYIAMEPDGINLGQGRFLQKDCPIFRTADRICLRHGVWKYGEGDMKSFKLWRKDNLQDRWASCHLVLMLLKKQGQRLRMFFVGYVVPSYGTVWFTNLRCYLCCLFPCSSAFSLWENLIILHLST